MSKEMLGGCCVCSDERGWTENPLVYCDGQNCTVAVHQACYGIVTVPTGPWFCRKCESQERAARVRCELCPSKDGALKRTDNSGWAHVVCALYIPEVRFGNVTTMEPIILQLIPAERYNKVCYICQEQGKGSKSTIGACMQCNKTGCKQQFHVTCAQALGLLCEEAGNYLDNVKYCGYCQHHYSKLVGSKLKKGGNVKTIPPYKPITSADNNSSDSSPEKESEVTSRGKKKSYLATKPVITGTKSKSHSPNPSPVPDNAFNLNSSTESEKEMSASGEGITLRIGTVTSHGGSASKENSQDGTDAKKKFTTSNFTETTVTESEPVFGTDSVKTTTASETSKGSSKKRKPSVGNITPPVKPENVSSETSSSTPAIPSSVTTTLSSSAASIAATLKNPTVSITNLKTNILATASKSSISVSGLAKSGGLSGGVKTNLTVTGSGTKITISAQRDVDKSDTIKSKTDSTPTTSSGTFNSPGIVVSVPLAATSSTNGTDKLSATEHEASRSAGNSNHLDGKVAAADPQPAKRARSSSSDKNKKNKRNSAQGTKRSNRSSSGGNDTAPPVKDIKESPPSSPIDETRKVRKKTVPAATANLTTAPKHEDKDIKPFSNPVTAPHMLGNQLNPNSSMAQKLHDNLNQEVEAHSIYTESNPNLVGPQLHSRVIASARASNAERYSNSSLSAANSLLSLGNSTNTSTASNSSSSNPASTGTPQSNSAPQSLEQLLERQWEQGSQFLMEQAQHFDIASLLSCLHQLKAENLKLEEHVNSLLQRRDHLLAINARLAVPLNTRPSTPVSQPPNNVPNSNAIVPQNNRQQFVVENGLPPEPNQNYAAHRTGNQSSPTIRQNPTATVYGGQAGGVRNSIQMDPNRRANPNYQGYPPTSSQVPVVTSPSMVVRREDTHQQM